METAFCKCANPLPQKHTHYNRLENLAWSHSFWQLIICRKHRFMKPLLLSCVDTLYSFNLKYRVFYLPPPQNFLGSVLSPLLLNTASFIYKASKMNTSTVLQVKHSQLDLDSIWLFRIREVLYIRINGRVVQLLNIGIVFFSCVFYKKIILPWDFVYLACWVKATTTYNIQDLGQYELKHLWYFVLTPLMLWNIAKANLFFSFL